MEKFKATPREAAALTKILSSKIRMKLFKELYGRGRMNISALARKAGCTNRRAASHLKMLAEAGVVEEKFRSGLHTFQIKDCELTELLRRTMDIIESEV